MNDPLLKIRDLRVAFDTRFGLVRALNGIDLDLKPGESLGLVGESGSGKSITALAILRLLGGNARVNAKEMLFSGESLPDKSEREMRKIRGNKISIIFQDPMSSLNPVLTVGWQVEENIRLHADLARSARKQRVLDMFEMVNIPDPAMNRDMFPHQFSGGMNQRIMIASALSCQPVMLIADEPTTALDVTTQAQILDLLKRLIQDKGTGLLMISHDLGVIREVCERVCVMYAGSVLEEGPVEDILRSPCHPYTRGLIDCIPKIKSAGEKLPCISGSIPKSTDLPSGCVFHPRCDRANEDCAHVTPPLANMNGRKVRCLKIGN